MSILDKEVVKTHTHTHNKIKNKKILPFPTTKIDFEGLTLSEISQTEKDYEILHDLTYIFRTRKS